MKRTFLLPLAAMAAAGAAGAAFAQDGDPARGEQQFQICIACHTGDSAAIAPNLAGVVGRKAGSEPNFMFYTDALQSSDKVWTEEALNEFLESPFTVVPGTTMALPVADPQARADVIAYLKTLEAE